MVSWVLVGSLATLTCRAGDGTNAVEPPLAMRGAASATPSTSSRSSGPTAASVAVSPSPSPALPKLKPIQPKPFPEAVDEATVCEAIDSKEPDVWVRFGHLVPAYVTGAVYALETGPETKEKLFDYILRRYVHGTTHSKPVAAAA